IQDSIRKTYGKKGEEIVQMNLQAVDQTLAHLREVTWSADGSRASASAAATEPGRRGSDRVGCAADQFPAGAATRTSQPAGETRALLHPLSDTAPEFVRHVLGKVIAGRGDELPVSALPADGTYPTGTAQWEKRNLALEIPV